jgi:hypothetical protein
MYSYKVVIPVCLRPVIMSVQREYRLSGIVSPNDTLKKKDSGQAGMTDSGRFLIFQNHNG